MHDTSQTGDDLKRRCLAAWRAMDQRATREGRTRAYLATRATARISALILAAATMAGVVWMLGLLAALAG